MRFFSIRTKGFTLAEVLIAIGIVAVLASIVVVGGDGPRKKARDEQRKSDIAQIQLALRLYKDAHGTYPKGGDFDSGQTLGEGKEIDDVLKEYIASLPLDPLNGDSEYGYVYHSLLACDNPSLGGGDYIVLYAMKMETPASVNFNDVCGIGGTSAEDGYGIVLQKR